ncbi:UNVERIFIED_CONTAM: hypothetical protein Sangu_1523000 [Sesamum angustifolium]|uniref:Uncharacterized protein n=1 Tax=Sesamum angustifolium TaxID=2727405 RepID=A0AAW2MSZ1_9LAMI
MLWGVPTYVAYDGFVELPVSGSSTRTDSLGMTVVAAAVAADVRKDFIVMHVVLVLEPVAIASVAV